MPVNREIAQRIVQVMNEALAADPAAVDALVSHRVPCNGALADHPSIVTGITANKEPIVGLVGILNGIAGIHDSGCHAGYGAVSFEVDTDDDVLRIKRFVLTEECGRHGGSVYCVPDRRA